MIDGKRVKWSTGAARITPAAALHSHRDHGPKRMRSLVIQDEGLHHYTRNHWIQFRVSEVQRKERFGAVDACQ